MMVDNAVGDKKQGNILCVVINARPCTMQRCLCSNCHQFRHWHWKCPRGHQQLNKRSRGKDRLRHGRHGYWPPSGQGGGRKTDSGGPTALMTSMETSQTLQARTASQDSEWCLDSGAQINICNNQSCFREVKTLSNG
ncbi:hypothetical protein GN244_ATG12996 [Phytophthora infestans]|uniref:Uncharacterized protein n=1 Tax=Phytophthora infestans TaxID=4787 RepID=A0A833SY62_PHYIN|nr:hypothetical protein GN244_ATG12996 [Phytophthora infestans]KAF4140230.1 hypothetical protein GN958_ATG10582 [Phytophthora infestans]